MAGWTHWYIARKSIFLFNKQHQLDLPNLVRGVYANNASAFDLNGELQGHVDIPRLRKGQVGGFFW